MSIFSFFAFRRSVNYTNRPAEAKHNRAAVNALLRSPNSRKALASARRIKYLLFDLGDTCRLLAEEPNAPMRICIYPVQDVALYTHPYIYINVQLDGLPKNHTLEMLAAAFSMARSTYPETFDKDSDVISMANTIGPLFDTTSVEYAEQFRPYIPYLEGESYIKTICRILTHYCRKSDTLDGFFDFRISLPDTLFTETTSAGEPAVNMEALARFIKRI